MAEVFDLLFYFERAARSLLLAKGSGQPVRVLEDGIAEKTACAWENEPEFADAQFIPTRAGLDPSYRD